MIQINGVQFDLYDGVVRLAERRVRQYSSTVRIGAAAQVLPSSSVPFGIQTVRYFDTYANAKAAEFSYLLIKGTVVPIIDELTYASSPYSQRFLVMEAPSDPVTTAVRARGKRGATIIDLSPAFVLTTNWTFIAVPVS